MPTRKLILAALSGGLLSVAFPTTGIWLIAWVALVPLLWVLKDARPREALLIGWVAGLVHFLTVLFWMMNTLTRYGGLSYPLSFGVLVLLSAYLALYVAVFAWAVVALPGGDRSLRWLVTPCAWVTVELARAHALGGFPWANLGYTQYSVLPIIQIADITGVYGVAFLVVLLNSTAFELLENLSLARRIGPVRHPTTVGNLRLLVSTGLVLTLVLGYGAWTLSRPERTVQPDSAELPFALLQGNIPQDIKWSKKFQQETVNLYAVLAGEVSRAPGPTPKLIVWPETAAPFYFEDDGPLLKQVQDLARQTKAYHLVGAPAYEKLDGEIVSYNRAYLIDPDGRMVGHYDKIHLVPFGEYVPFSSVLFFVGQMAQGIGTFYAGDEYTVFEIPQGRFGTLICFEVIFPNLVRKFVKGGAQFLVNITNDAWFGRSAASSQHLSMAAFRAVENRVPLIRAANTGITAVVDPFGRIRESTDLFVRTYVTDTIAVKSEAWAVYSAVGDLFAYLCVVAVLVVAGFGAVRPRRHRGQSVVISSISLGGYEDR
jgi:apolipoprotein N-acyltransferase